MIVPPTAAAPVTTEKALNVSPEPAAVNVNLSYTKRVSPVVADVVAYDELMFCAVVTEIGSVDVPPIKPFKDDTGPVNVVIAIIFSFIQS